MSVELLAVDDEAAMRRLLVVAPNAAGPNSPRSARDGMLRLGAYSEAAVRGLYLPPRSVRAPTSTCVRREHVFGPPIRPGTLSRLSWRP